MYTVINTCPVLTEEQAAEIIEAAARAIHIALTQLIAEDEE